MCDTGEVPPSGTTHRNTDGSLTEKQAAALTRLAQIPANERSAKQARQLLFLSASPADLAKLLGHPLPAAPALPPGRRVPQSPAAAAKVGLSREERRELTQAKLAAEEAMKDPAAAAPSSLAPTVREAPKRRKRPRGREGIT